MYKSYRTTKIRKHTSYCIGFLFWHPFFLYKTCFVYQAELVLIIFALLSNFQPDVLNPLVLKCGCLLYY